MDSGQIQRFLNALGNMCGGYWLTYSTRIPCQTMRHLWQQLLFIVCKDSISIMKCIWWQGGLGFLCSSFSYFTGFPSTSRRLRGGNLREKIPAIKNKVS
jgi:hypothetical protein